MALFTKHPTKTILLLLAAAIMGLSSCHMACVKGKGPVVSADKSIEEFSQLEVNVPAEVYISLGEEPHVSIRAQENIIQAVSADVKGDALVLKADPCVSTEKAFIIEIVTTGLSGISVNGSANVEVVDKIMTDDMEVEINGSGDVSMELVAEDIDAEINGSGDIVFAGNTEDMRIQINGSGDVKAIGLQAEDASVNINGSGDVEIGVSNELKIRVAGSGNVRYAGNPKIDSSVSGSGEVTKMN